MTQRMSDVKKAQLRHLISKEPQSVESLVGQPPSENSMAEIAWLDVAVAVGAALVVIDKHLDAVGGIFKKLKTLHSWLRREHGQEAAITNNERIVALLARKYLDDKGGLTAQDLREQLMVQEQEVDACLKTLKTYNIIRASGEHWVFRASALA